MRVLVVNRVPAAKACLPINANLVLRTRLLCALGESGPTHGSDQTAEMAQLGLKQAANGDSAGNPTGLAAKGTGQGSGPWDWTSVKYTLRSEHFGSDLDQKEGGHTWPGCPAPHGWHPAPKMGKPRLAPCATLGCQRTQV